MWRQDAVQGLRDAPANGARMGLVYNLYMVFPQQSGQSECGETSHLNFIALRVDIEIYRGAEVGFFQVAALKSSSQKVAIGEGGPAGIAGAKIDLAQQAIGKRGVFNFGFVEGAIVEMAGIEPKR